jgi:hypothetical protein
MALSLIKVEVISLLVVAVDRAKGVVLSGVVPMLVDRVRDRGRAVRVAAKAGLKARIVIKARKCTTASPLS